MRRRLLGALLGAAVLATACAGAGAPQTRRAVAAGHPPLSSVVILVDTDVMGAAFASYQGSLPFESRRADSQGFFDRFAQALRDEANAAGLAATVETVSLRAGTPQVLRGRAGEPVLTLRATQYGVLRETVGGRNLGWRGDTSWEFSLAERSGARHETAWSVTVRHVNLNPALCGRYEQCGATLARQVFQQLREAGLVR